MPILNGALVAIYKEREKVVCFRFKGCQFDAQELEV